MAKHRKPTRVSPALTPKQARDLKRLKQKMDVVYRQFWVGALGIVQPPRPPKVDPLLRSMGDTIGYIARIKPPPDPPQ